MSRICQLFHRRTTILLGIALASVIVLAATAVLVVVHHTDRMASGACPDDPLASKPAWAPTNNQVDAPIDAHPYLGNGYLGLRMPPRGTGYTATDETTGWPLYTPAYDGTFVAGLYARIPGSADNREVAAAIPNWSGLLVGVGEHTYSPATPAAQITNFAQTLHLRCGLVRTRLTWTTPDAKTTDLVYDVLTDQSDQHVGAVHITVVPHWPGEMVVSDLVDGAGARRVSQSEVGARDDDTIRVGFRTDGTEVDGDIVSVLRPGAGIASNAIEPIPPARDLSVRQDVRFPVHDGDTYQVTKFVGVDTTRTSPDPAATAFEAAQRAVQTGWANLLAETSAAWRARWRGDIEVPGQPDVQTWARGALYSLYSSTNSAQDNSISPDYSERTDPDGPAMTDSVHAIDAATLDIPGCATGTFLERAARPFVRAPFGQFAEARGAKVGAKDPLAGAPAFTFVTTAGGFLQTFTNGLLGLRFDTDEIRIAPPRPPELPDGLTIHGIHWQGRTFDATMHPDKTELTLTAGRAAAGSASHPPHATARPRPARPPDRLPVSPTDRTASRPDPADEECHVDQCRSGRPRAGASTCQALGSWASKSGQVCMPVGA